MRDFIRAFKQHAATPRHNDDDVSLERCTHLHNMCDGDTAVVAAATAMRGWQTVASTPQDARTHSTKP